VNCAIREQVNVMLVHSDKKRVRGDLRFELSAVGRDGIVFAHAGFPLLG
jgi:uncharacterized protein (DUF952 family)